MTTLANTAHGRKKPTKRDAQALVHKIAETINPETCPDEYEALAGLYAFFMPPRPTAAMAKKAKDPFNWVALAASKEDVRFYLQYVYATGSEIVATDGHRLHTAPDTREPGYYEPATGERVRDPDWHKYPDYKAITPAKTRNSGAIAETVEEYESDSVAHVARHITDANGSYSCAVNTVYLDQAILRGEPAHVTTQGSTGPVRLDMAGGEIAVVMPVKL